MRICFDYRIAYGPARGPAGSAPALRQENAGWPFVSTSRLLLMFEPTAQFLDGGAHLRHVRVDRQRTLVASTASSRLAEVCVAVSHAGPGAEVDWHELYRRCGRRGSSPRTARGGTRPAPSGCRLRRIRGICAMARSKCRMACSKSRRLSASAPAGELVVRLGRAAPEPDRPHRRARPSR